MNGGRYSGRESVARVVRECAPARKELRGFRGKIKKEKKYVHTTYDEDGGGGGDGGSGDGVVLSTRTIQKLIQYPRYTLLSDQSTPRDSISPRRPRPWSSYADTLTSNLRITRGRHSVKFSLFPAKLLLVLPATLGLTLN